MLTRPEHFDCHIDNYDSFLFNIARYFRKLGEATEATRHDAVSHALCRGWRPHRSWIERSCGVVGAVAIVQPVQLRRPPVVAVRRRDIDRTWAAPLLGRRARCRERFAVLGCAAE